MAGKELEGVEEHAADEDHVLVKTQAVNDWPLPPGGSVRRSQKTTKVAAAARHSVAVRLATEAARTGE